jgi:hypothetical protein
VVAILPSGRSVWQVLDPAPATVRDVDRLVVVVERNAESRVRAIRTNAQLAAELKLSARRGMVQARRTLLRARRRLLRRLVRADDELDRRIDQRLLPLFDEARLSQQRREALTHSCARRDLLNQAVVVSALPLMAAFGHRNSPFAQENIVLAASAFVFLFGDEISDLLGGKRDLGNGPPRGADLWSYTAPFANLLSVWWLLCARQHERFVTGLVDEPIVRPGQRGIAVFTVRSDNRQTDTCWVAVDLSSLIAPDRLVDFTSETEIVALATLQSLEANPEVPGIHPSVELVRTEVKREFLWVIVVVASVVADGTPLFDPPPLLRRLAVSWLVDTCSPRTT